MGRSWGVSEGSARLALADVARADEDAVGPPARRRRNLDLSEVEERWELLRRCGSGSGAPGLAAAAEQRRSGESRQRDGPNGKEEQGQCSRQARAQGPASCLRAVGAPPPDSARGAPRISRRHGTRGSGADNASRWMCPEPSVWGPAGGLYCRRFVGAADRASVSPVFARAPVDSACAALCGACVHIAGRKPRGERAARAGVERAPSGRTAASCSPGNQGSCGPRRPESEARTGDGHHDHVTMHYVKPRRRRKNPEALPSNRAPHPT